MCELVCVSACMQMCMCACKRVCVWKKHPSNTYDFHFHSYFYINTCMRYNMETKRKKFPLSSDTSTHIHTLSFLSLSPLPHWTGQLDGLFGMMERLHKEVDFEICFEGSKGGWRIADGSLVAERAMFKCLELNYSSVKRNRYCKFYAFSSLIVMNLFLHQNQTRHWMLVLQFFANSFREILFLWW